MRTHALPRTTGVGTTATTTRTRTRQHPSCNASDVGRSTSTSAASTSKPPSPSSSQYRYVDAAGKRKATLQDAAPSLLTSSSSSSSSSSAEARAPWELGFQLPERSAALWGDDLRRRLIRHALAARFGGGGGGTSGSDTSGSDGPALSEEEIDERLAQLARLLPGLAPRLAATSMSVLSKMLEDPAAVAATLVGLRETFPGADIGRMVSRSPQLALAGGRGWSGGKGRESRGGEDEGSGGLAALAEARAALAELLPNLDVDAAVSEHPSLLDVEGVASAIAEARRVLGPSRFELGAFEREPSLVFRFQHGDLLIPYDQFEKSG